MKSYLVKMPKFLTWIHPQRVWAFSHTSNKVYLTFDDGPIPEVTPWVLEQLANYNAKATFFCIGDNVKKNPKIFQSILDQGHSIGNHTQHHLNGFKNTTSEYLKDVILFEETVSKINDELLNKKKDTIKTSSLAPHNFLFRPPYGKMNSSQAKSILKKGYKIIMWDILSADFDTAISKEKCLQNVLKHINQGSIVVFHDSLKAEEKLRYVLPKVLEFIDIKRWKCTSI